MIWWVPCIKFYFLQVLPAAKGRRRQSEELNKNRTWFSSGCPWPGQGTEGWGRRRDEEALPQKCLVQHMSLGSSWHVNLVGPFCIFLAKLGQIVKIWSDHSSRGHCKGWGRNRGSGGTPATVWTLPVSAFLKSCSFPRVPSKRPKGTSKASAHLNHRLLGPFLLALEPTLSDTLAQSRLNPGQVESPLSFPWVWQGPGHAQ